MSLLECPICESLMSGAVTVSCGHSFCRRCAESDLSSRCPACEQRLHASDVRSTKNNVLLCRIIEKCCPQETEPKGHLLERLRACDYSQALQIANDGLKLAPNDVSLKVLRAEANMGLQNPSDALQDLDDVCHLHPVWSEGFFRKGNVLVVLGRARDALLQYHHCLELQADFVQAKNQMKKILEAEGLPVPEEVPKLLQVVSEYVQGPWAVTSYAGPTSGDGLRHCLNEEVENAGDGSSVKAQWHLDPAASFLQAAKNDKDSVIKCNGSPQRVAQERDVLLRVLTVSDFECPLCIRLFYEPVTTPCGHTFCKSCIERSLDHNLRCPLCKQPLNEYLKNRKYSLTAVLQDAMCHLFPLQLEERKQVHDAEIAELSDLTRDIPIFVCTAAFPGIPCPLHVFEPRYRLMMRRCLETGTRRFGMCTYEAGKGFADYGCVLEIQGLDPVPDGRSYVYTVGGSRFRVMRRGKRDGYHTADIEYLEDQKVEGAELDLLRHLHDSVYQEAREWFCRLSSQVQAQITRQCGPMPDRDVDIQASSDGPTWCWWLLSVLQLDPSYKTTILSLTSLKDRLYHLRIVLE